MTIDLSTPIMGKMDVDRTALIPLFSGHQYPANIVSRFLDALIARSKEFGVRASIVAAQIAKETGYFRFGGQVAPGQYNLAGLGATNGGAAGMSYPDIETGVLAVFVHHLVYMFGAVENWPANLQQYLFLDHRYQPVISTGRAGSVKRLGDYTNGNWAFSPQYPIGSLANGYATGIAEIANTITTEAPVATEDFPTIADLGFAVRLEPQRLNFYGDIRPLSDIRWWVQHDTEGYYEGDISTLTRTKNGSVHFIIGREWGQLTASVPIKRGAWTPGNDAVANQSVNVEMSGFADGRDGGYTDWQYFCNGVIWRWCVQQGMTNVPAVYIGKDDQDGGPEPDHAGILGHQDVPDPYNKGRWGGAYHHSDPGPLWDWNRMIAEIGNVQPAPPPVNVVDGKVLGQGFYDFYRAYPTENDVRARSLGILLEGDHDEWMRTGAGIVSVVAARFERAAVIWDRGATPAPWDVRIPLSSETLYRHAPASIAHLARPTERFGGKQERPQ